VEYTVTLADFGKPFELSIPIVKGANDTTYTA
jgi:hypothetical protein